MSELPSRVKLYLGYLMQIHEKLKTIRLCKNWTQEELADKLGWGVNTYAKMERGESDINFNFAENCAQSNQELAHCTILLSESQCAHELDKTRLIVAQKDREIAWLKEECERLKEINALLRKK